MTYNNRELAVPNSKLLNEFVKEIKEILVEVGGRLEFDDYLRKIYVDKNICDDEGLLLLPAITKDRIT